MREEVLYVIFLDLTKAYDSLDRSRSLEILKGYGVGDRVRRLLTVYWERTTMVARAGSYYGKGFKGEQGVTQGNLLSPTIFNVVVEEKGKEKTAEEEEGEDLWGKMVEMT